MTNIFPIDFEEKLTMAQDDYILFSDSEDGNKIKKAQYKNLKGEKGDPGTPGQDGEDGAAATITVGSVTTGAAGSSATVVNSGTSSAAVLDFSIPQGIAGTPGQDGEDGEAATITVGTTTTLPAGSSATVTNSGTSSAAVLNFGIPKGDAGVQDAKVFTLSSTSDLTNAQAAYDWYASGKEAIILYSGRYYYFKSTGGGSVYFAVNEYTTLDNTDVTSLVQKTLTLALSGTTVTSISSWNMSLTNYNVLRTGKDYGTPYTPQYDGSPATKKYVDDSITGLGLGTAATKNTGTSSGNVPVLDSNGHLASSTIPGVALTDTFTVSTSSDLTSLSSADQGDIAIVTTENKTYVLSQAPYSTAANWKEILAPTGGVTSVNGQTGAVTIDVPNTKTFYLSGILDLTTAQAAYDWYVAGKNPIIISGNLAYNLLRAYSDSITFYSKNQEIVYQNTRTMIGQSVIQFEITSGTVTEINISYGNVIGSYLDTQTNYTTPYTPEYDGSPATKKYVDDHGVPSGGNNGDVLTNVSGTPTWSAPSGGDVVVSSQANNILTSGMKIWAGTQADYEALASYDSNTLYLVIE